jgi:hypothetical protein
MFTVTDAPIEFTVAAVLSFTWRRKLQSPMAVAIVVTKL